MFFDEGSEPPPPAIVLPDVCSGDYMAATCDAGRLASEAQRLLTRLRARD
jgi:hypothetical protein